MLFFRKRQPEKLLFKTDIHCHLIPGVDDGSPDASTSADLAERMSSWGIERIVATPHVRQDYFENTPDILDPAFEEFRGELQRRGSRLVTDRSAEYRIDDFFKRQLEAGTVTPLPNNLILIENPFHQEPWDLDKFLYDLRLRGLRPILAHPERYYYYCEMHPARYEQLYRSGIFLQINLLSFAGYYGKPEKKAAWKLLEQGFVDFIGTDLHNHHQADKIEEFLTTKAYRNLAAGAPKLLNDTALL